MAANNRATFRKEIEKPSGRRKKRVRFCLQPTKSFREGAPQREEYNTDRDHDNACVIYAREWLLEYVCTGCRGGDCPQHGNDQAAIFDVDGNYDFKAMRKAAAAPPAEGTPT